MNSRSLTLLSLILGTNLLSAQDKTSFASFIELPWRYVIGGHSKGKWLNSEAAGKRLTAPKTEYRVFTLDEEVAKISGAKAAPDADVCPDVWMQKITPDPELQKPAIGVHASWEPMPRKAKLLDTKQDVYRQAVTELLSGKGITRPTVTITQLLRVDLDDDGEFEVLVAATHYIHQDELMTAERGDYSFVAVRRVVKGKVQTQVLSGEFYPKKAEDAAPNIHQISGVLDLNGDGVLEVLVNSTYYEGGGLKVWQLQKDQLITVLEIECGV